MSPAADTPWRPEREIEIVAGTAPGGGLDRTARALAAALAESGLAGVPARVVNVPGDGARKAWTVVAARPGDPHLVSISSPNLATDRIVGLASFDHADFTPLAILYTEYIGFVVRAGSRFATGTDLAAALARGGVTVALSTALGNPNHIALAQVIRAAGGDPRSPQIRVFDSALDAVADVVAGNAEVGAVTAASAVRELAAGTLRPVAVSAPDRLSGLYAQTPTWREQSVDCVMGAWRGVTGPRGLAPAHVAGWERLLEAAIRTAAWQAELERHYWTPLYVAGATLADQLAREQREFAQTLAALGLAAPRT